MSDYECESNEQTPTLSAKYLTAEDCNIAASLLYQAYHDDLLFQQILNYKDVEPSAYEKKLRLLIREELASFWKSHQHIVGVCQDDNLVAVSCILNLSSDLSANRVWHWRLKLMLNTGALSTKQLIDKETRIRESLSEYENTCFISLFAVDPHMQHQGFGRYLLRAIDDIVKTEQASSSAIFVTQSTHKPLFESEGYTVLQSLGFTKVSGELLIKQNRQ